MHPGRPSRSPATLKIHDLRGHAGRQEPRGTLPGGEQEQRRGQRCGAPLVSGTAFHPPCCDIRLYARIKLRHPYRRDRHPNEPWIGGEGSRVNGTWSIRSRPAVSDAALCPRRPWADRRLRRRILGVLYGPELADAVSPQRFFGALHARLEHHASQDLLPVVRIRYAHRRGFQHRRMLAARPRRFRAARCSRRL